MRELCKILLHTNVISSPSEKYHEPPLCESNHYYLIPSSAKIILAQYSPDFLLPCPLLPLLFRLGYKLILLCPHPMVDRALWLHHGCITAASRLLPSTAAPSSTLASPATLVNPPPASFCLTSQSFQMTSLYILFDCFNYDFYHFNSKLYYYYFMDLLTNIKYWTKTC